MRGTGVADPGIRIPPARVVDRPARIWIVQRQAFLKLHLSSQVQMTEKEKKVEEKKTGQSLRSAKTQCTVRLHES
jgi:hypothetical protein